MVGVLELWLAINMATSTNRACKQLTLYRKAYPNGDSKHVAVFQAVQEFTKESIETVLYPGCHRHITASLCFPEVTYVDCDSKVGPLYSEEAAIDFVTENKRYSGETACRFLCADVLDETSFTSLIAEESSLSNNHYDLLISLSAGIIAAACTPCIKKGGYLLVNDSHSDARSIFVDHPKEWELKAFWNGREFTSEGIKQCFLVVEKRRRGTAKHPRTSPQPMTSEQVEESIEIGTTSRRSFRTAMDSAFYLFQKL